MKKPHRKLYLAQKYTVQHLEFQRDHTFVFGTWRQDTKKEMTNVYSQRDHWKGKGRDVGLSMSNGRRNEKKEWRSC